MNEDITQKLIDKVAHAKFVHIVTIGTKPDIIKQAPIYNDLKERGETVLLFHTGQHYDYNYSGGVEEEFGLDVDVRLIIDGSLAQKTAEMIRRFGTILEYLLEQGKVPIPYVHGDTSTASAIAYSAMLHGVACIHVEAGIRTLTPRQAIYHYFYKEFKENRFDWNEYYIAMQDIDTYTRGSMEPFPEQVNTRMIEPAAGFYATPVEITKDFLIAEGFEESKIKVVGNTIADPTLKAVKDAEKSTIFEQYPLLKNGNFIMVSIHRRETLNDRHRFLAIIDALETLAKEGYCVLFISLNGTEQAIDRYELRERIEAMAESLPEHFIYSEAWAYHRDVIAAMKKSALVASDSGGFQEEANIVGVPCVTLRYGSDRGESFIAGANVPAPPFDSDFMVAIIKGAFNNDDMRAVGNIYGSDVSKKIVDGVLEHLDPETGLYMSEERRLGFTDFIK
jgi:UDP-N-acetylglucosamine 2-epimerase (non-hydrolysing)